MTDEQFNALVELIKAIRATNSEILFYDASPMNAYIEKARDQLVTKP